MGARSAICKLARVCWSKTSAGKLDGTLLVSVSDGGGVPQRIVVEQEGGLTGKPERAKYRIEKICHYRPIGNVTIGSVSLDCCGYACDVCGRERFLPPEPGSYCEGCGSWIPEVIG